MNQDLRLVLFDCDGTLVDSQHSIVDAMQAAFDQAGLTVPGPAAVRHVVGLGLIEAIAKLAPAADDGRLNRLADAYKAAFASGRSVQGIAGEPLFGGILDVLESLSATDTLLGVATGKSRRGLTHTLTGHGIDRYFTTLHTADDGPGKPHPHMVEAALKNTGAGRARTVVIGDTTYDMEMAANAGVRSIGVGWGYHAAKDLVTAGATVVVDHPRDLATAIAGILGP